MNSGTTLQWREIDVTEKGVKKVLEMYDKRNTYFRCYIGKCNRLQ